MLFFLFLLTIDERNFYKNSTDGDSASISSTSENEQLDPEARHIDVGNISTKRSGDLSPDSKVKRVKTKVSLQRTMI